MADQANIVEETLKRIKAHKGILGIMILTGDGIPIKSDLPHEETVNYAGLVTQFVKKAWDLVKKLPVPPRKDSSDDAGAADEEDHAQEQELEVLRLRSEKHEMIITPEFRKNGDFILIVIQNPTVE